MNPVLLETTGPEYRQNVSSSMLYATRNSVVSTKVICSRITVGDGKHSYTDTPCFLYIDYYYYYYYIIIIIIIIIVVVVVFVMITSYVSRKCHLLYNTCSQESIPVLFLAKEHALPFF